MTARGRPPVTQQDILAYVDGELEPGTVRAEAVEAYLAENPEADARVRAYERQNEAIRTRYRDVLAQPVPDRLTPEGIRAARTRPGGTRRPTPLHLAAGLAGLGCAALVGWLAGHQADTPLERFVDRTSTYLSEHDDGTLRGPAASFQSVSALGGTPDFAAEGLELVGTRQVDNGDMYETRYEDTTGRVLRLFVAPDPQRHNELLYRTQEDGRKVVYWQQGPLMYALTGDFSDRDLDGLANKAIRRTGEEPDAGRLAGTGHDAAPANDAIEPVIEHRGNSSISESGKLQASQSLLEEDPSTTTGNGSGASVPAVKQKLQTDYRSTQ